MIKRDLAFHSKVSNGSKNCCVILGRGSISKLLYDLMIKEGFNESKFKGFIETNTDKYNNYSLKVYSKNLDLISDQKNSVIEEIQGLSTLEIYPSIGYSNMNKSRANAFKNLKKFLPKSVLMTFISKEAYICEDVEIEEGCLIFPRSIVESSVKIKKGTVLWFGSHICHHSLISEFCWIAAQSIIGAKCIIGERTFFGVGGIVPTGSNIAKGTLITAGSTSPKLTKENQVVHRKFLSNENKSEETSSDDYIRFL